MECVELLRKEIDGPSREVSDIMIAAVINMAGSEVSTLRSSYLPYFVSIFAWIS